jgi:hypothetical protein
MMIGSGDARPGMDVARMMETMQDITCTRKTDGEKLVLDW